MLRNIIGFAVFAVISIFLVKVFFGLFGLVLGLLGTILWLAVVGFVIYLILKLFAPDTADRVREMVAGRY
jgi:predicted lipid-binding transport protein (Tim44 family)